MLKVIAIVGPVASGKGTVVDYLVGQGYKSYALRDEIVREMTKRNIEPTRENFRSTANGLREKFGNDVLAKKAMEQITLDNSDKVVIESFRNSAELEYFKKQLNIFTIGLTSSLERRFQYLQNRQRFGDPQTWEEFIAYDKKDRGIGETSSGQQVDALLQMADVIIENNGTIEELHEKINFLNL